MARARVRVRWAGAYPVELQGRIVQPGEEVDVEDDVGADLCREGRGFERAHGRKTVPAEEG